MSSNLTITTPLRREAERLCGSAVDSVNDAGLTLLKARHNQLAVKETCDQVIAAAHQGMFLKGDDLQRLFRDISLTTAAVQQAHNDYVDTLSEAGTAHRLATLALEFDSRTK